MISRLLWRLFAAALLIAGPILTASRPELSPWDRAIAQGAGLLGPNQIWGNPTGSQANAQPTSIDASLTFTAQALAINYAHSGTWTATQTWSAQQNFNGSILIGAASFPTLSSGQGAMAAGANSGLSFEGFGATNDYTFFNKNGQNALSLGTGGFTWTFGTAGTGVVNLNGTGGALQVNGTQVVGSTVANGGTFGGNGSTYDGALVNRSGNVGCGVLASTQTVQCNQLVVLNNAGGAEQINPGGRLTLASGVCAPVSDSVAAATLYYAPCASEWVPIYNGTNMLNYQFTSSPTDTVGLSIALGANWASSTLYDVFVGLNGSTVTLCTGPAWNTTSPGASVRGSGAGTSQLALYKGIQTNAVSMTCRFNNTTTFTCAINQCTYVGTVLISLTGAGAIDLQFGTAAVGGGTACICIWNLYNQIQARPNVQDTTATFSPATGSWFMAMGNNGNRIRFITGLALQSYVITSSAFASTGANSGDDFRVGCALNSTAPTNPDAILTISTVAAVALTGTQIVTCYYAPALGFNYVSSVYRSGGHSATFSGAIPNAQYHTGLLWF